MTLAWAKNGADWVSRVLADAGSSLLKSPATLVSVYPCISSVLLINLSSCFKKRGMS